jgi:hypothetical protein
VNSIGATGLTQILKSAHPDLVRKFNLTDPLENLEAAKELYDQVGLAPWAASRSVWGSHLGRAGSQVAANFKRGGLIGAAAGLLTGKANAGAPHATGGHQTATTSGPLYQPKSTKPSSKRTRALAALKGKIGIPGPFGTQFDAMSGAISAISDIQIPHLDSVLSRLGAQYLVDADDDASTPDIVNQKGVTLPDGTFVPGIDQAVAILNQELGLLGKQQGLEQAQQSLAAAAVTQLKAAVAERSKIWNEQVAKIKKNADRIKQINRRVTSIDAATGAIDKKKTQTAGDKATRKRLKAERGGLVSELHGLHASQTMLTGDTTGEPSAAVSNLKQSTGPVGRTWRDLQDLGGDPATEGQLQKWQSNAAPLAGALVAIGDTILDKRKEIEDATGTKPPKPDTTSAASNTDALKDLQLQQANEVIANLRLQVAQDQVFSGFKLDLVGGLGGFARGTERVLKTGLALIHEDETISPSRTSAFGSQLGNNYGYGGRDAPEVTVVINGDVGGLIDSVKTYVDGVEQRVNARIGRDGRQLAVAPGR